MKTQLLFLGKILSLLSHKYNQFIWNSIKKYFIYFHLARLIKLSGLSLLLVLTQPVFSQSEIVGHISYARGSNAAQQPGAEPRILGKDSEIYQGDNIQTTGRSFVIIKFIDGSEVTIRPDSNFSINHFDNHSHDKAVHLTLYHGGLDASTGEISKGNPDNFQIKTPTATIRPKSEEAEFTVDICDQQCEEESRKAKANAVRTEQSVVAIIVDMKGEVSAKNQSVQNAQERRLSLNSPLFNSDAVYTGQNSYALLVFPDGEKVTLQADTELDITQYIYQISGKNDQLSLRLVTGGLRALTGAIGKKDPAAVTLETPVATIGIRGTGTDSSTDGTSLSHSTWQGLSFVRNEAGEFDVPEGHSSFTSGPNDVPVITATPKDAPEPSEPRPDKNEDDPDSVFEDPHISQGDVSIKTIKGEASIESKDGNKATVKDGETTSTSKGGETRTLNTSPASNPFINNSRDAC